MNKQLLYEELCKLNIKQFKFLYGNIVHCWAHGNGFISDENFNTLWYELNILCYDIDDNFPNPYEDHNELKMFCHAHPYYFIDRLPIEQVAWLFSEYCDKNLGVLFAFVQILHKCSFMEAQKYILDSFKSEHTADELVTDLENHIRYFL